jgi:hypothetical protein
LDFSFLLALKQAFLPLDFLLLLLLGCEGNGSSASSSGRGRGRGRGRFVSRPALFVFLRRQKSQKTAFFSQVHEHGTVQERKSQSMATTTTVTITITTKAIEFYATVVERSIFYSTFEVLMHVRPPSVHPSTILGPFGLLERFFLDSFV